MSRRLLAGGLAVCIATSAMAYVIGGSNLGYSGYPEHKCFKPSKPIKPFDVNDQMQVDFYKRQVLTYNLQLSSYAECIKDYVNNAKLDMQRIQEAAKQAVDEFNSL